MNNWTQNNYLKIICVECKLNPRPRSVRIYVAQMFKDIIVRHDYLGENKKSDPYLRKSFISMHLSTCCK